MPYRLVICDDNKNMRAFLRFIINTRPDLQVVAEGENGAQAVALCREHHPDCMLIDVQMEDQSDGIDAIAEIRSFDRNVKLIVLTVYSDDGFVVSAFRNGANNFLLKDTQAPDILKAIDDTLSGNEELTQMVAKKLRDYVAQAGISQRRREEDTQEVMRLLRTFTKTEQEILQLLYKGYSREDIARQRVVEPVTIKAHISNILRKSKLHRMEQVMSHLEQVGFFSYRSDGRSE